MKTLNTYKMKTIILSILILTSTFVFCQTADNLKIQDTRNVNNAPNTYTREVKFEFKDRSIIGVPGTGVFSGMFTIAPWLNDGTGNKHHQVNFNDGGVFYRSGVNNSTSWGGWRKILTENEDGRVGVGILVPDAKLHVYGANVGSGNVLSSIMLGKTNGPEIQAIQANIDDDVQELAIRVKSSTLFAEDNYEVLRIKHNGNVGIGTIDPKNKLSVNGTIWAKEVKVSLTDAADWVFENGYNLISLEEVESFVKSNKHLPDMPSADEFRENGLNVADMDNRLLQKVEELTLYLIEQNKKIAELQNKVKELETKKPSR